MLKDRRLNGSFRIVNPLSAEIPRNQAKREQRRRLEAQMVDDEKSETLESTGSKVLFVILVGIWAIPLLTWGVYCFLFAWGTITFSSVVALQQSRYK
jgi:hypothetical protein